MSMKRVFQVTCDACGAMGEREQYDYLKASGFKYMTLNQKILHLCPMCAKDRRPDKEDKNRVHAV